MTDVPDPEVDVWTPIGPIAINWSDGSSTGVLFHIAIPASNPSVIYVSSRTSGVWASSDHGARWRAASGDLPSLVVLGLAVDAAAPDHLYVVLGEAGVYESKDAGGSWTKVGAPPGLPSDVTDLIVDPSNGLRLYLRAQDGIYRSDDGGATWQPSLDGAASHLVMAPSSPRVLYAGLPHQGVFRTRDGGARWTRLLAGPAAVDIKVAVTAADAAVIYTRFKITSTENPVYATNDGGRSWSLSSTPDWYVELIAADDTNAQRVYVAGVKFYRSDDRGATWAVMDGAHDDHHAVASDPGQPTDIYTACDGGLYLSAQGNDWTFVADGIANVEFFDLADSTTRPELAIGGTQDNGTVMTADVALEWTQIWDGDGATVAIDPTNADVMYMMQQYASTIARSDNGGASHPTNVGHGLPPGHVCFNLRFGLDPTDPRILLACCNELWLGVPTMPLIPWRTIFTPPDAPAEKVTMFAIGPDGMYHVATNLGRIYAGVGPGGGGWPLAFHHPSGDPAADLVVDPDDPQVLYAAFAGGSERVYRLHRSAPAALFTAIPITAGLPSGLTVKTLAVDAMRPLVIYAGTNQGVYRARSTDQGASWIWDDYNAGLPPADVRALRVHSTTGLMRAATFGRSAFQVNTDMPVGSLLNISGRLTSLRVHDVGTRWGRPPNELDAEVIFTLDTNDVLTFGFQLRADSEAPTRSGMLSLLRAAFVADGVVSIDFIRTAPRVGTVTRVARID
jgi:photosystem II stability/assembly factor-like uncharacterized protein